MRRGIWFPVMMLAVSCTSLTGTPSTTAASRGRATSNTTTSSSVPESSSGRPSETSAVGEAPLTIPENEFPRSPLAFRDLPAVVWTGTRLVVWGGFSQPPYISRQQARSDGASFDPLSNTWQLLPDAPIQGGRARATMSGRAVVVMNTLGETALLDDSLQSWTRLPTISPRPDFHDQPAIASLDGLVIAFASTATYVLQLGQELWRSCAGPPSGEVIAVDAVTIDNAVVVALALGSTKGLPVFTFDPRQCAWSEPRVLPVASDNIAVAAGDRAVVVAAASLAGHTLVTIRFDQLSDRAIAWSPTIEAMPLNSMISKPIPSVVALPQSVVADFGFAGIIIKDAHGIRAVNPPTRQDDGTWAEPPLRTSWRATTRIADRAAVLTNSAGSLTLFLAR